MHPHLPPQHMSLPRLATLTWLLSFCFVSLAQAIPPPPPPAAQTRAAYARWKRLLQRDLQQGQGSPLQRTQASLADRQAAIAILAQDIYTPPLWWLAIFRDPAFSIRHIARQKLEKAEDYALPSLIIALRDKHPRVRLQAAQLLGRLGKQATSAISSLSIHKEREPGVRVAILQAIGKIAPQEAVPMLAKGLSDPYYRAKVAAAVAFGTIRPPQQAEAYLPKLFLACRDAHPDVRFAAAQSLGQLKILAAPSVIALQALLRDKVWRVQAQSAESIGRFGPKAAPAVPALLQRLRDTNSPLRSRVALALAQIGKRSKQALPILLQELSQDTSLDVVVQHLLNPVMRPLLVFRIGGLEKPLLLMFAFSRAVATYEHVAISPLRKKLRKTSVPPLWLLFSMGRLGPHAKPFFTKILRLKSTAPLAQRYLRNLVLARIAPNHPKTRRFLLQQCKAKEQPLRIAAAVALQSIGQSTPQIQQILQEDDTIRRATERTFRMMRDLNTTPYLWRNP
ncbi:MAG: HEAT repeat domain-containing protein [Myxococcales bacterium]|nr:HEAT repeat domain-containing protein [Myxococcales bacterium]